MPNFLVTGATGLLGAPTIQELVGRGDRVVGFDILPNRDRLGEVAADVELVPGDVTDFRAVLEVVKRHRIERIIHFAAATADTVEPTKVMISNCVGTGNILEAARLFDLERVVWASSAGVYGSASDYEHGRPLTEDDLVGPFTVYRASKVTCEQMSVAYREQHNLDTIAVRPVLSYGVGRLGQGAGLLNDAIRKVALGRPARFPAMFGPPEAKWQPMYSKDMARTFVAAAMAPRPEHCIFNAAGDEIVSVRDTIAVIRSLVPDAEIALDTECDAESTVDLPLLDGSRARDELGMKPIYDIEAGFADMIEIFRSE